MSTLQIKNVPDDLHAELRRRARIRQMTVRDYLLDLIVADQQLPTMAEWLDGLTPHQTGVSAVHAELIVDTIRTERDARTTRVAAPLEDIVR